MSGAASEPGLRGVCQVIIIIIIMIIIIISFNDAIKQTGNYSALHVVKK